MRRAVQLASCAGNFIVLLFVVLFVGRTYFAANSEPTGMALSAACIGLALTGIQFATIVRRDEEGSGARRPPA